MTNKKVTRKLGKIHVHLGDSVRLAPHTDIQFRVPTLTVSVTIMVYTMVTMEVGPSDCLYLLPYWCVNRKYRWTLSLWTTIGSGRRIPLATSSSAATPRGRSYATGVTCSQTRADQSHSGTRYRKCRRRTNWAMSTLHQSGSAENWVRSSRPGR